MRKWSIGHINGKKMPKQYCSSNKFASSLKKIGTFDDVLDMWSYFNNIDIKLLGINSCLYVFEENILPMWEDENNIGGYIYKSYIEEYTIDEIFIRILLMMIGEIFYPLSENELNEIKTSSNDINGIYLKRSYKMYELQIWTKKDSTNLINILNKLTNTEWKSINIH